MTDAALLFELHNVRKTRLNGPGYALYIPRLSIGKGERLAITGPSGSGKSTALDILGMALQPDEASTFLLHAGGSTANIADCWRRGDQDSLAALRLKHMGYVLQTGGLLPFLSARQNMELPARLNNHADSARRVHELAVSLGIERLLEVMPGKLSIGERQRVAIGRALASRPSVILADEPTAALDPFHAEAVLALFMQSVADLGATLIMVTHDHSLVERHGLKELCIRVHADTDGTSTAVLEA